MTTLFVENLLPLIPYCQFVGLALNNHDAIVVFV
jgi:hypothetical protein